ncbi:MAG: flagellar hook-length control protein FliK [Betaproteobacteria bacterium]|nr:flagellar hook-length control protein FliK [Betaproteobacteria bacterium]MDE2212430.1 flagellar hook-length control protein FliK [Betaproteobacteria bacterium]
MKSLPITPGVTPAPSPSQPAAASGVGANAGTGANAASADGSGAQGGTAGQTFNNVLARQMAGSEAKPAATPVAAVVTDTALKLVEADKTAGKTADKTVADSPDAASVSSAQAGLVALMGLPLVPGQMPSVPGQPASPEPGAPTSQPAALPDSIGTSLPASFGSLAAATALPTTSAAASLPPPLPSAAQESFARNLEQAMGQATLANGPIVDSTTQSRDSRVSDAAVTAQIQSHGAAQMLMSYTPAAGPTVPQSIGSPVGSSRWGDELGQKITWMTTQTDHSAELHLNPPDLGPLKVVLHVSGDQASAFFTSPHAAVREAVSQALPRLRDMLADNGIMLGNATVSDQGGQGAQNAFTGGGQQQARTSGNGAIEVSSVASGAKVGSSWVSQGLVDTFA